MSDPENDARPGLAIVVNSMTPYGVNLQRAIAAGIPELKLHVLVSHTESDFNWQMNVPAEIHVARFGAVGEHPAENSLRRPVWDWRKGGRLTRHVRDNDVRAVILNGYRYISFLRLMNHCHGAGIPFFVNNDSNIRNEPRMSRLKQFVKRTVYGWWTKRASGVMPMGALGDRFFIKYGADPQRLYRVPCWPDFDALSNFEHVALERFRRKFGFRDGRRHLLFCGRLIPCKRIDLLLDAFAAIAGDRPDWDLMLVGDGVLRDELQRRVPEALRPRVVWTGFLDAAETTLAYHATDVLVLPSENEAWSLVIQEAMAAGLVVVSSDVPGAAYELIEDGQSGKIFPVGNLEELKRALLHVTENNLLPQFKQESRVAFARWRNENDPVAEIRRALVDAGVLKPLAGRAGPSQALKPAASR